MKFLIVLLVSTAFLFAQSTLNCPATQVCSAGGEDNNNAGGKASSRIGNGSNFYRMLIRVDLGSNVPKMPCTLFVYQRAFVSASLNIDWPSYDLTVSSVPGVWNNGTANEDPQEGSVCHRYRAYSSSTPTPWVVGNNSSTVLSVINGSGGSHVNSNEFSIETAESGNPSTVVLDEQLLRDLIAGYGGIAISRAPTASSEILFHNNSVRLRWDPNGTPVNGVEKYKVVGSSLKLAATPNPFTTSSVITYGTASSLPVQVYGISGALVATLNGVNGKAMWNGCDFNGNTLPNGAYVIKIADGKEMQSQKISIVR